MTAHQRTIDACNKSVLAEGQGHRLGKVKKCRAWILAGGLKSIVNARQIDLGDASTLDEAHAAIPSCGHKDTLFIHEIDEAQNISVLHAYRVRKGVAIYRRNHQTGLVERHSPLKPDLLFSLPVDAFDPTRPFDAFLDDASGIDRGLVRQ